MNQVHEDTIRIELREYDDGHFEAQIGDRTVCCEERMCAVTSAVERHLTGEAPPCDHGWDSRK